MAVPDTDTFTFLDVQAGLVKGMILLLYLTQRLMEPLVPYMKEIGLTY